jgi:hypothetical protein
MELLYHMGLNSPVDMPSPKWYINKLSLYSLSLDEVDEGIIKLLFHFISSDHLSIYQLYKAERLKNEKLLYKSTHKAFQRLVDLNLVEKIGSDDDIQLSEKELVRRPNYYKLSEEGLFTLYIKNKTYFPLPSLIKANGGKLRAELVDLSKNFLLKYRRYDFYRFCLYPWIEHNTIARCSPQFAKTINDLLSDICIYMEKSLKYFYYKHTFSQYHKEMDILEEGIHAWEKDDKMPMRSLLEKIDKFEKKEKENKNDRKKMYLPSSAFTLKQRDISGQISAAMLEEAKSFNLKPLYYRIIFSLVMGNIKEEDKKLLEKDTKFKRMLDEVNTQFKNNYTALK